MMDPLILFLCMVEGQAGWDVEADPMPVELAASLALIQAAGAPAIRPPSPMPFAAASPKDETILEPICAYVFALQGHVVDQTHMRQQELGPCAQFQSSACVLVKGSNGWLQRMKSLIKFPTSLQH